jgi:hypothetical protein
VYGIGRDSNLKARVSVFCAIAAHLSGVSVCLSRGRGWAALVTYFYFSRLI